LIMDMAKSSRHSKITGDFGEHLVLYWLSKYGFECASVNHTGIDLIARNPHTKEVMGISVKSRSRNKGKEEDSITIDNDNFEKAEGACKAFGCVPYMAIVVDADKLVRAFITPMSHFLKLSPMGRKSANWKMRDKHLKEYYGDSAIKIFEMKTETISWWQK